MAKQLKALQTLVEKRVERLQKQAEQVYGKRVPNVEIKYNLKSVRVGGQARSNPYIGLFQMELHPAALHEYQEDYIEGTVVHEFAHLVQKQHYPQSKPHGKEWKQVMRAFGKNPERCHSMDLRGAMEKFAKVSGKPAPKIRQQKRWGYKCGCDTHQITTVRHNKIQRGQASYCCRACGGKLVKA